MDGNGFGGTKIIAYEHNWVDSGQFPVQVLQQANSQFAGAGFHCYAGDVSQQEQFESAFPLKEVYFTECTGLFGTGLWGNIKWWMDNLWVDQFRGFLQTRTFAADLQLQLDWVG